jgi:hypothetical protein
MVFSFLKDKKDASSSMAQTLIENQIECQTNDINDITDRSFIKNASLLPEITKQTFKTKPTN